MNKNSHVSIIIPARNESIFIAKCLDSIIANNFPKNRLEVIVVDGMSDDGTTSLINNYANAYPFIKILYNERKITPVAMNLGIRESIGDFVIILSSHSTIDKDFIQKSLETFNHYDADCVGGRIFTLPAKDSLFAKSIALTMSHPFGVGNSYFRIGTEGPRYVDTVPFGCYRKNVFGKIGVFDINLVRNQDDEINLRLIKKGGKILLNPEIISYYSARDSILKLWRMYYQYGYFKPLVAQKVGGILTWRQVIPAIFVTCIYILVGLSVFSKYILLLLLSVLFLYLITNITITLSIAFKKGIKFILSLPFTFLTIHFSYGTGYLKGVWDFIFLKKQNTQQVKDVPMTR